MSANEQERAEAREKITELLAEVGLELKSWKVKRLTILWRRVTWLKKRIASASEEGKVLHYDENEAMATEWAVNHIIVLEEEIKRLREEIADIKKGERQ
ncbi:hypothetical protein KGQ34_01595 [Patescibacteria group bacterium]|nr:hypothetical protein [Patescibacteria group bacterium]